MGVGAMGGMRCATPSMVAVDRGRRFEPHGRRRVGLRFEQGCRRQSLEGKSTFVGPDTPDGGRRMYVVGAFRGGEVSAPFGGEMVRSWRVRLLACGDSVLTKSSDWCVRLA